MASSKTSTGSDSEVDRTSLPSSPVAHLVGAEHGEPVGQVVGALHRLDGLAVDQVVGELDGLVVGDRWTFVSLLRQPVGAGDDRGCGGTGQRERMSLTRRQTASHSSAGQHEHVSWRQDPPTGGRSQDKCRSQIQDEATQK